MDKKKLRQRNEIEDCFKWNIEAMYPSEELWQKDVDEAVKMTEEFNKFQGHLTDSAETLAEALQMKDAIWQKIEKAFVNARMKLDEDNRVSLQQGMLDKVNSQVAGIAASMSFFTPELLEASEETLRGYLDSCPALATYRFLIESILREKEHVLSAEQENILARLSEVTDTSDSVFTMLNNADMKFGKIRDEDGDEVELTHGNYIRFMESHNREVRKAAFTHVYEAYKGLINTISTLYNYNVKTDVIGADLRHYSSSRNAAMSGDNIPEEVYDNLVNVVHQYLPVMHRYLELRKKVLGVDELKMYDVYVPLVKVPEKDVPFEEAVKMMKKALAPLGEEYLERLDAGVKAGWIDVYENEGKTSGAYSFGSYDSFPYVLLNYTNSLQDVFTVVHEMGHSMHSSYTRENQPFIYGGHSIFTAEVASTVNEALLMRYLLNNEKDPEMHKYLLNKYIEAFRTTLFRQTMFAEFEHLAHKYVEEGGSLTAEWLCETYNELNRQYHGPAVAEDEYIRYEWSRIPHFYRSFYVYQYATGYSAATAISGKILKEGAPARDAYKEFLKTGESDYPVELLKIAGVDMSTKEPVLLAMETFKSLVDELESLL